VHRTFEQCTDVTCAPPLGVTNIIPSATPHIFACK